MRHVALHDFNVWQRRDRLGLGRIAYQRAHGNAAGRQHAQQLFPVQSGGACHEDHGGSPVRLNLAPSGAIAQVWTKMILCTFLRSLASCSDREIDESLAMAKAKSALTCG